MRDGRVTNGNRHCFWEILSADWSKFQDRRYTLKEFGREKKWPNVAKIVYDDEVSRGLKRVIRWQAYADLNVYPQDSFMHIFGLTFLAYELLGKMNGGLGPNFDKELVIKACMIHDVPGGLEDLSYEDKNIFRNIEKHLCFKKLVISLCDDPEEVLHLEKIYLLQFCLDDFAEFPPATQVIIEEVSCLYRLEAICFRFLEEFDYLIFAEEQYVRFGIRSLLERIAVVHLPIINQLVEQLPCLERVWTPVANDYFSEFIVRT